MPLIQGQALNQRYRIVKLLGQGGFGAVYRAWDTAINHACALKENLDISSEAYRQFEREALILASLSHPNLPRVTDHFSLPGQGQYLVMDFVDGDDLETIQARSGVLSEAQVLPWIGQICDALAYLHAQNPPVIHRDLKPANIRITPDGRAMLVDFGIAKVYDPRLKTTMGARAVTPGYSPAEQYGQGSTDARTDIYALGATLYTLLTGQPPVESIQRSLGVELPSPRSFNPAISAGVERAILRAMEILPARRFQTAAQFKHALTFPVSSPQVMRTAQMPVAQPTIAAQTSAPAFPSFPPRLAPAPRPLPWKWIAAGGAFASIFLLLCALVYSSLVAGSGSGGGLAGADFDRTATALARLRVDPTRTRTPASTPTLPAIQTTVILPRGDTDTPFPYVTTERPYDTDTPTPRPTDTPTATDQPAPRPGPGDSQVSSVDGMLVIYIDGFWIDRSEVTNAMYALCVRAGACTSPADSSSNTRPDYYGNSSFDNYPVVKINHAQAIAYCSWAGGRLPTSGEWAKAANNNSGSRYPWGNPIDCSYANIKMGETFCVGDTTAVGSYPAGASPFGLWDMAGNVFEWVADSCAQGYNVRGGCWNDGPDYAEVAKALCRTADSVSSKLGFRCVR